MATWPTVMRVVVQLVLLALLLAPSTPLKPLPDQSFAAPFTEYNSAGTRVVSSYRDGGHTKVNEHFIRLTPDFDGKLF